MRRSAHGRAGVAGPRRCVARPGPTHHRRHLRHGDGRFRRRAAGRHGGGERSNIVGTETATTTEHGLLPLPQPAAGRVRAQLHHDRVQDDHAPRRARGRRVDDRGERGPGDQPAPGDRGRGRGSLGGGHHLQRGGHQLRPRVGGQRAAAALQLLRPGGGRARLAAGRRLQQHVPHMVFGSSYDENSFQVDGVDVTDNYFNEALAEPNTDAIQEIEVLSLGAPAEYGNLTGAVYNIVTRQGTNEFHGDAGFYLQTDSLTANNTAGLANPDGSFLDAAAPGRPIVALPLHPRQVHRHQPPARRPHRQGQAVVLRLLLHTSATTTGTWASTPATIPRRGAPARTATSASSPGRLNPKHKLVGTFHLDNKADRRRPVRPIPCARDGGQPLRQYAHARPGLHGRALGPHGARGPLFGVLRQTCQYNPTDPNQPRDLQPLLRHRHRLHLRRALLLVPTWAPSAPPSPPRSPTWRTSSSAPATTSASASSTAPPRPAAWSGTTTSSTPTAGSPSYGRGLLHALQLQRRHQGHRRVPGRHVRVNSPLSLNVGLASTAEKAFSAEQAEPTSWAIRRGPPLPSTDYFTWNTLSPRLGFNWRLTADGTTMLKATIAAITGDAIGEYANKPGPASRPSSRAPTTSRSGTFGDLTFRGRTRTWGSTRLQSRYTNQFIAQPGARPARAGGRSSTTSTNAAQVRRMARSPAVRPVPYVDDEFRRATAVPSSSSSLVSNPEQRSSVSPTRRTSLRHQCGEPDLLKRMSDDWQLTASGTWLRGTVRCRKGRAAPVRPAPECIIQRGGLQFRPSSARTQRLRQRGRAAEERRRVAVQGQAIYQLPGGFPASATSPTAAVPTSCGEPGTAQLPRCRRARPSCSSRGARTAAWQPHHPGPAAQKDFRLGERRRISLFADAFDLFSSRHHRGRPAVAGGVGVRLPVIAGETAALQVDELLF